MLEQRIGRLDRIGQRGDVHLHVAAVRGSAQEVLLRWLHEGVGAFEHVAADGRELLRHFAGELLAVVDRDPEERELALAELVARTRSVHAELSEAIARGRDRLLELGSRRGTGADALLPALRENDAEQAQDDYPLRLLEAFGVHGEPLGPHTWLLDPEYLTVEGCEELKAGARAATFDRATALGRDDLLYLRADHPMLLSAQEMLASGEAGNAAFLIDDSLPPRSAILECVYVVECVAPPRLDAERWLPPTPETIAVDSRLQPREGYAPNERAVHRAAERQYDLSGMRKVLAALVPPMLERARAIAEERAGAIAEAAAVQARAALDAEIVRLEALARVNPAVRPEEIRALHEERALLLATLPQARPRLDALRLVASPDFLSLRPGK
jgi:ATP-dependent helicase HepA